MASQNDTVMNDSGNVPFKIDGISESTILGPNNRAEPGYTIRWTAKGIGSFTTQFAKSDFNEAHAAQQIQVEANKLGTLVDTVNNVMYPNQ